MSLLLSGVVLRGVLPPELSGEVRDHTELPAPSATLPAVGRTRPALTGRGRPGQVRTALCQGLGRLSRL